jgi:hypothetical protein
MHAHLHMASWNYDLVHSAQRGSINSAHFDVPAPVPELDAKVNAIAIVLPAPDFTHEDPWKRCCAKWVQERWLECGHCAGLVHNLAWVRFACSIARQCAANRCTQ